MPATQALALFRARKLSPVELMKAVIARPEMVNRKVNAFNLHLLRGGAGISL
jgi:hypothetical protein